MSDAVVSEVAAGPIATLRIEVPVYLADYLVPGALPGSLPEVAAALEVAAARLRAAGAVTDGSLAGALSGPGGAERGGWSLVPV